jgi:HSP20 family protein
MVYRSMFSRDLFAEMDRLQRAMQQAVTGSSSIRGRSRGYPALNIGSTPSSVEIYVFAPGMDPASLDVQFEKGTLTLSGERKVPDVPEGATVHIDERFAGRFRRVLSLPDDVDSGGITANYRDGVLHVHVPRSAQTQPRRIAIH